MTTSRAAEPQLSDQRIAERRIVFGPFAPALQTLDLHSPIAVLGTTRSIGLVDDGTFGGAAVHRFAGAGPHNPRATVDEAAALVDERRCATIVAVGSSAAIDLGKAVADKRDVTLALIPTALGGAEMSRGYGVLEGDRKGGGRLASPAPIVIYDPALLATLPPRELGSIGINAWAHTIEAAYAHTQHVLGTAAAVEAGHRLPGLLRAAARDRGEKMHRALFEAAHLAGFALDTRSMGLHHAVCHVIGGLTRFPHGINNAIVLPHAVRANARLAPDAVADVAAAFGFADLAAEAEAIAAAYALPRTFAELGAPRDLVERAVPLVMAQHLLDNNPVRPDEATVERLLRAAYGAPRSGG
ncbi:MAG TPA: iron-containing alcohol dehydrogenase [Candidatus Elarobacter sp.]|jgi:alcohol dehydrogenase class IV|nr:iron-containing alcohol dehydrogenase [Candidatus Elarobacter sp.]